MADLHKVIELRQDGTFCAVMISHEKLHVFFGCDITFVGALDEFGVVAVGKSEQTEKDVINPFCQNEEFFEKNVRGNVLLIGSDEEGVACDINERILSFVPSLLTIQSV